MKKNKQHFSKFAVRVYAVVKKIPRGRVMTYKRVAAKAGSPRAYRGVGTLMAKNFNPKIPCHRVIRSDGTIGNYHRPGRDPAQSGGNRDGEKKKRALLKKEGAIY